MSEGEDSAVSCSGLESKGVEKVPNKNSAQEEPMVHLSLDDSCSSSGNLEVMEKASGLEPKDVKTVSDQGLSQGKPLVPSNLDHLLKVKFDTRDRRVKGPLSYHPYFDKSDEIVYGADALFISKISEPVGLKEAGMILISTVEGLRAAVKHLEKMSEIGVALQRSNNYLFFGTEHVDYAVDTILLEEHLPLLVPIFIDPNITKVMVQALKYLCWLQQKHGLFVANLFDLSIGSALVPDAAREVRELLRQKFGLAYRFLGECRVEIQEGMPEMDRLRVRSRFSTYLFRKTKNALLTQHGVEGYLKIKHTMDGMCKEEYCILDSGLYQLVKFHEAQKKLLPQLWAWRRSWAEAHSVPAESVMTNESLMDLLAGLPKDNGDISFFASSKYVDQDMSEVKRIMRSAPTTIKLPYYDDPDDWGDFQAVRREQRKINRQKKRIQDRLGETRRHQNLTNPSQLCQPSISQQVLSHNKAGPCRHDNAATSGIGEPQVPSNLTRKQRKAWRNRQRTVGLESPIVQNNVGSCNNSTFTSSADKRRKLDQTEFRSSLSYPKMSQNPQTPQCPQSATLRYAGNPKCKNEFKTGEGDDAKGIDTEIAMIDQQIQQLERDLQMRLSKQERNNRETK